MSEPRIIESKKQPSTGLRYHYCPKTEDVAETSVCKCCPNLVNFEQLPASYRVHCSYAGKVEAIIPSHAEDEIPSSWGTDKFNLSQYPVIEPKLDGARCVIVIDEAGCFHFFTRRTNRFGDQSEITANLPHMAEFKLPELANTTLDAELFVVGAVGAESSTGTESTGTLGTTMSVVGAAPETAIATQKLLGWAEFYCFDCMKFKGQDLTKSTWAVRHETLQKVLKMMEG